MTESGGVLLFDGKNPTQNVMAKLSQAEAESKLIQENRVKQVIESGILKAVALYDDASSSKHLAKQYQTKDMVYKRELAEKLLNTVIADYQRCETRITEIMQDLIESGEQKAHNPLMSTTDEESKTVNSVAGILKSRFAGGGDQVFKEKMQKAKQHRRRIGLFKQVGSNLSMAKGLL